MAFSLPSLDASGIRARVESAIARAATATGMDFGYLLNQAKTESNLNPQARARTSSASGLYQFVDSTWLSTLKRHGAEHGLGWAAGLIQRVGGRLSVRDPAARAAILNLKTDPEAAAHMAAAHAADNADTLQFRLGRAVNGTDLYMAHFLGPAGAARFLARMATDGAEAAADLFPKAAAANRAIFFKRDGSPRSLAEIYDRFAAKIGVTEMSGGTAGLLAVRQSQTPAPGAAPDVQAYARAAYRLLAEFGA